MTDQRPAETIEAWPSDDSGRALNSNPVVVAKGAGDTKTCPACAEEVKAAARICRYCGYDFDPAFVAAHQDQVPVVVTNAPRWTALRWTTLRFLLPIGLIFVLLLGLALFLSAQLTNNLPGNKPSASSTSPTEMAPSYLAGTNQISVAGLVLTFPLA